jgi:hypothetical protein
MLYLYRIYFMAKNVECEFVVKASNYEDAKEQLFVSIKNKEISGLYYKSLDQSELTEAEIYVKENKIRREDIKRTHKLNNDEWI